MLTLEAYLQNLYVESMKFSIIVPTYNRGYVISNLIRSVLSQSYKNWELLIADDGSTDNTSEVISTFGDSRIVYLSKINGGPSSARNLALNKATGDWIVYIDSDNEFLSNYLDVVSIYIEKFSDMLFTSTKVVRTLELYSNGVLVDIVDDSENYPNTVSVEDIFLRNVKFDINGFAHSRKIIDLGYRWNEQINLMEDWDFFMSFADRYQSAFKYINIPVVNYHQKFGTDGLVSNAKYEDWAEAFEYLYQKYKTSPLMKDQKWYPNRVLKYRKLAQDFKDGKTKPPYLKYFPSFDK